MTQYLISFDEGAMTFSEQELPDVAHAGQTVATREEALEGAARIAVARRCAQEVRELVPDPAV
ncbi:hypothetical protein IV500_06735 [Paeniglutamicibacter antarcticus]|uniref:Uncharacterized protein n=1 Tax=Arthrobacter terrae TaxID=2935737 RepID=A0A931G9V7_9MICC|nr:hypothetical protein [Arthrobacter terrae]MBG0739092.1 hypothetical protein [Arthrobacter terrae]